MRSKEPRNDEPVSFDMTPMIDCVFQLVVFFMLTLNFADDLQNEMIKLPSSELAKPNDAKLDTTVTLQLTAKNSVIVGSDEVPISGLRASLQREREAMEKGGKTPGQATVIIRADRYAKTGAVQEMIEIAQALRFEKFVLRAKGKDA